MNKNKRFLTLVVILIAFILLATSVNSSTNENIKTNSPKPVLFDNYYEWTDDFDNEQYIDITKSWGYEVTGGHAIMKNTYSVWTEASWEKLKPITLHNSGSPLAQYALQITIPYDSDMDPYYNDIRFKHESSGAIFLNYWIESYDTTSANVWVKIPIIPSSDSILYLFYDNPSATSESNFSDVFTIWDYEFPSDEQVTYHGDYEGAWDPDVSYGGGYFLVAWEEGQPYNPPLSLGFKQEIRGSMYAPDGSRVVFDQPIYQETTTYYRNENPSVAYGGGKYFVAWERYPPTNLPPYNPPYSPVVTTDVYARLVQKSGSAFTLGSVITISAEVNFQNDPKVVFDNVNSRFMVVWEDARLGTNNYNIYAKLYNLNGEIIGTEKTIVSSSNTQCEPWAAFDPVHEQYMIVWEDGVDPLNGPWKIMGGIFTKDLNPVWTGEIANSGSSSVDYNFPCVSYNAESNRFLVTWNADDISAGDWRGDVWGKIYDNSGNVIVSKFLIKGGEFERTGIVNYLSDSFFVSFDNENTVFAKLVSSTGNVMGDDIQVCQNPAADADWASIATNGDKIFAAWEDIIFYYPWNQLPDVMANIFNLNIPSGSTVTYTLGQEKEMILLAQITTKQISFANLLSWHDFLADSAGTVAFDILDATGNIVLKSNINSGQSLSDIDPEVHPIIRLRARYTRNNPSYTPELDSWTVRYVGIDTEPPRTYIDIIDGEKGLNDWYIEETVIVYLRAVDFPSDTGSGVNKTYYSLNGGTPQIYNVQSGIGLTVHAPDWMGVWEINFWSMDNQGNVEDRTKPENYITIKIDGERPFVQLTEPANEQSVAIPFWVRANAYDNAQLDRVEFDIEPFGERPGLPFKDYTPPYEWLCDVPISRPRPLAPGEPEPTGVNLMVRAQAFDKSGQTMIHEVWVYITNPISRPRIFTIANFKQILEKIKIGIVFDNNLQIDVFGVDDADSMKLDATRLISRKTTTYWDNDFSNGASAQLNIPTGFYKIVATLYKDGKEIESELISRVLFINK